MEITSSEGSNLSVLKWKENKTSFHFLLPWWLLDYSPPALDGVFYSSQSSGST